MLFPAENATSNNKRTFNQQSHFIHLFSRGINISMMFLLGYARCKTMKSTLTRFNMIRFSVDLAHIITSYFDSYYIS